MKEGSKYQIYRTSNYKIPLLNLTRVNVIVEFSDYQMPLAQQVDVRVGVANSFLATRYNGNRKLCVPTFHYGQLWLSSRPRLVR